jgi:2-polyprenyl-3-methyl-5-hydroxy-6-metoxy-1,4-benzoquinol methylase
VSADDSSTRSWDAIADDWIAHADANDYRNFFLLPRMLAMLGEVRGRRILDLGCGEGGYARELARRGASVTGVDGSERLIAVARERAAAEGLAATFLRANANALDAVASGSHDAVVAAMSLMDVEDLRGALREVHRVLVPGGELVMSITHPCFSAPVSEWVRDDRRALLHFAVDRYLERTSWDSYITPSFRAPVVRRHRPLEDYMSIPLESGLILREFREPEASEEERQQSRRFAKLSRIPYFLFMRWQKAKT